MNPLLPYTALSAAITTVLSMSTYAIETTEKLDQLIVSATKSEQLNRDITATNIVITSEQLEEQGIQTLTEALDRLAGLPIIANGGMGSTANLQVRGHDSQRVMLLVDGMRFNDPASTSGANFGVIALPDIERIEILLGSQAAIWGLDAGVALINVITKTAKKEGTHGSISYAMGGLGQKETKGNISYVNRQFDGQVGILSTSIDGYSNLAPFAHGQRSAPTHYESDGYQNEAQHIKLGVNIDATKRIEVNGFNQIANSRYDGFSEQSLLSTPLPNDPNSRSHYEQNGSGIGFHFDAMDWKHLIQVQKSIINRLDMNSYNEKAWQSKAETVQYSWNANRKDTQGNWTIGADKAETFADMYSNSLWAVDSTATGKYDQQGVFINRVHKLSLIETHAPTIINIGIRYSDHSVYDSSLDNSMGIKQTFTNEAYVQANIGHTRRSPSLNEQFGVFTTSTGQLQPEKMSSQEIAIGWKGYSLTRFDDTITNLIDYYYNAPSDTGYHNVAGASHINGWEWRVSQPIRTINSELQAIYTVLDAKNSINQHLASRPDSSGQLMLNYLGIAHTFLSLQTQYMGDRYDNNHVQTGQFWLWHANASYQPSTAWRFFVKGINLTDQRLIQTSASTFDNVTYTSTISHYYAYTPRTLLVGIEYKF